MVAGAATLSGSAAAFHFEKYDRVRVKSGGAETYDSCCTTYDCYWTERDEGDEGEVSAVCEYNSTYDMIQVIWDTGEGGEHWISWVLEDDLEHA